MYEKFSIANGEMVKNAINYVYPDAPKAGETPRFPKGNIVSVNVIQKPNEFARVEIVTKVSVPGRATSDFVTWNFSDTKIAGLYDVKVNDPKSRGQNPHDKFHDEVMDVSGDFMSYLDEIGAVKKNNVLENYLREKQDAQMDR